MTGTVRGRRGDEGFTLLELLVVIIVIGILAAFAIPTYLRQREKAYRAEAIHDMKNAAIAVETFASARDDSSYLPLHGATETSPALVSEGFRSSNWVSVLVSADATSYCIEGRNVFVPGKTFVYRSDDGVVEVGVTGTTTCA